MVFNEELRADIIFSDDTEISIGMSEITGSFSISSQAVGSSTFELGGVNSAQLSASFKVSEADEYVMLGAVIKPQIYKNNSWVSLGVFNVTSSNRYRDIITVTAADNMIWLDKSAFTVDENERKVNTIADYLRSRKSIYQALKFVVEDVGGLELAHSQSEIEAMPNGNIETIVFEDIKNYCPRDWLSWIAETLGGFAYADSEGKIAIRQFETNVSAEFSLGDFQENSIDIADFQMLVSKVEMDVWDGSFGAISNPGTDGKPNTLYVDLSDNWIVQGKHYLYGNAMDILGGVYHALFITYRPFSAIVHTNDLLYLGQCIRISDYEGNEYVTVITNHTYTLGGGQKIECVGSDTRLLSQTKQRSQLKRESEKLQTMIEESKGKNVTESELEAIIESGKFCEGQVFYIYDDESNESK